jgi:hypothetical protein
MSGHVPKADLVGDGIKTALYELWLGLGVRLVRLFVRGVLAGFAEIHHGVERAPAESSAYRLYRRLGKQGFA